jgi:hypothetical protein
MRRESSTRETREKPKTGASEKIKSAAQRDNRRGDSYPQNERQAPRHHQQHQNVQAGPYRGNPRPPQYINAPPQANALTCHNCKKSGHYARQCRAPYRQQMNHSNSHEQRAVASDHALTSVSPGQRPISEPHTHIAPPQMQSFNTITLIDEPVFDKTQPDTWEYFPGFEPSAKDKDLIENEDATHE